MKKILSSTILLLLVFTVFAQQHITKGQLDFLDKGLKQTPLLADDDKDFTNTAPAGKWDDESAIILGQKTTFDFNRDGAIAGQHISHSFWDMLFPSRAIRQQVDQEMAVKHQTGKEIVMVVAERERRKILLKDKFAIDQYAVLYFRLFAQGDAFAARVIKADGSVQKVDLSEAVTVGNLSSVPGLFKSYTGHRFSSAYRPDYFKIAVPNLEEGDVVEYEYINMNEKDFPRNTSYVEFNPIYYLCNRTLPVVHQAIEIASVDERYHIAYKSLKGSPDFTETTTNGKRTYRWEDNARDKIPDVRYLNEYLELPSIKFQMVYASDKADQLVWFKNDDDMKKDVSPADLSDKIKTFWYSSAKLLDQSSYAPPTGGFYETEKAMYKLLKKRNITDLPDDEFVNKAYYTIRGETLYRNWSDFAFAKIFSALLDEKKIENEIVATASNVKTNLNSIAFAQELSWMVKYKTSYYCNPDEHLNPGEIPFDLMGNTAVKFSSVGANATTANEVIPAPDTLSSKYTEQITATLDMARGSMAIVKNVEADGLAKQDFIDEALALTPFMQNDYTNYDGTDMWEGLNETEQEKAMNAFTQQKKEWKEQKPLMMKDIEEDDYGHRIDTFADFHLLQDGRSFKKKALKYQETFTIADLGASAGDDMVVALSNLIGSQAKIKKDERVRNYPINISYPREIFYTISMPVPAGYTVKGLDGLTKSVSNECGSFMSIAELKSNYVVVSIKKTYKLQNFDAAKWPLMLNILDASYKFSQSKIILKKG